MKLIKGEYFKNLADIAISKEEHCEFEGEFTNKWIDIDKSDLNDLNYDSLVYANISLINRTKPVILESDFFNKLYNLKNPFSLILHNADQNFEDVHLKYFDIPNLNKIYAENVNTVHPDLIPLPMGIANSMWHYGESEVFEKFIYKNIPKTQLVYFWFTVKGGAREESRPYCYNTLRDKGFKLNTPRQFEDYIEELSSYKYCISPPGNTLDCYRMWECLYLKVVPICIRNPLTEYYSKIFPIFIVDRWEDLSIELLEKEYKNYQNWENYHLLDFDNYVKKFIDEVN